MNYIHNELKEAIQNIRNTLLIQQKNGNTEVAFLLKRL